MIETNVFYVLYIYIYIYIYVCVCGHVPLYMYVMIFNMQIIITGKEMTHNDKQNNPGQV